MAKTHEQEVKDAYSEGLSEGLEVGKEIGQSLGQPVLGPLQPIWDAWEEHRAFIDGLPNVYFQNVISIQFNEIDDHAEAGDLPEKTNSEIVDIISISLNWFRSKGLDDQGVADAISARLTRYADTAAIIKKYNEEYGL